MKSIISNTCDVIFKRLSDGKIVFTAEAQLASISHKIKQEKVKGGIGNRDIAVLRSDKEIELKVKNAVFDSAWLEMACGLEYVDGTNTVYKSERGLVCTGGKLALAGTPKDNAVTVFSSDGNTATGTYATGQVTLTDGVEGKLYTAIYQQDVTGKSLKIDSTTFADKYSVEYKTIEYDMDTNEVVNDLYWVFNSVVPNSSFDLSFENGKAITPEFTFTAMAPAGSTEIGKVIEAPRV